MYERLSKIFGFEIMRRSKAQRMKLAVEDVEFVLDHFLKLHGAKDQSKSQIKQDIFVLFETGFKRDGFFIEFGATNGFDLSNTYLLEKDFGWSGILAEPAIMWHDDLKKNRSASIETDCVWRTSGETIEFNMPSRGELSTIAEFNNSDDHASRRKHGNHYSVNTISLHDLLEKHNAPKVIDYLSIDTEGSEFEILNAFDFTKYDIRLITCEHNYTPQRERIFDLLTKNGYERKYENLSRWDDWYVRK